MVRDIDIALLRAFLAVAEHGSVSAAATALHLTQGAVSQRIARLEARLGARLLDRHHQGTAVAPAGERLLGHARAVVEANDALVRDAQRPGQRARVRLGAPSDLMGEILPAMLRAVSAAAPDIDVAVTSAMSIGLEGAYRGGQLDLVILQQRPDERSGELLWTDPLRWAGAPNSRAVARRPLPLAVVGAGCRFRRPMLDALDGIGMPWSLASDGDGFEATVAAVRADLAVSAFQQAAMPPGLAVIDDPGLPPLPDFVISLLGGDGRQSPTATIAAILRDFVRTAATPDRCGATVDDVAAHKMS